jgi:hypothetical protein
MKPVDHISPTLPTNRVQRTEDKRRKDDAERRPRGKGNQDKPDGGSSDGRHHIIDELA